MKRYSVNWGQFLGQGAGTEVVCDGDVCRIVPAGSTPTVPPSTVPIAQPGAPPAPASSSPISIPWLAVGAAAGIGVLILALR